MSRNRLSGARLLTNSPLAYVDRFVEELEHSPVHGLLSFPNLIELTVRPG